MAKKRRYKKSKNRASRLDLAVITIMMYIAWSIDIY